MEKIGGDLREQVVGKDFSSKILTCPDHKLKSVILQNGTVGLYLKVKRVEEQPSKEEDVSHLYF